MNKNAKKLTMLLAMGNKMPQSPTQTTPPKKKATKKKKVAKKALPWSSQNKGC